jgi:hypothetical protein
MCLLSTTLKDSFLEGKSIVKWDSSQYFLPGSPTGEEAYLLLYGQGQARGRIFSQQSQASADDNVQRLCSFALPAASHRTQMETPSPYLAGL